MPDTLTDDQMQALLSKQGAKPAAMPDTLTDDQMADLLKSGGKAAPTPERGKEAKTGLPEGVVEWKGAGGQRLKMHQDLTDPFMLADQEAFEKTGKHIGVGSSYRSTEEQKVQYDKYAPQGKRVAKPGSSLHEKGRALDIKDWKEMEPFMKAHGFVNPFPDDPNHFVLDADNPYTTGKKIARATLPYAKTVLPYGGAMAGSIAGGIAGGTAGSVVPLAGTAAGAAAGAAALSGLGYATGNQALRALEEYTGDAEPEKNPVKAITQAGMDVLHGAAMEAGGQVAGKYFIEPVVAWATGKLANAGKELYRATMKPSVAAAPEKIEKAVTTGLEGKYWLTDKGLEKLKADRQDLSQNLGKLVDKITRKGGKVDTVDVAAEVQKLKDNYKGIDAKEAHAAIDERITAFWERVGQKQTISAKDAHEIKQGIYKDIGEKAYGEMKAAAKEADKQIARHINEQLKAVYPEYGRLNQDLSDKINLQKYLQRAVNRIRNHNRVSLTDVIAMGSALSGGTIHGGPAEGAAMATATYITKKALDSPAVKSRLAYALYKSARLTGQSLGKPIAYGVSKATENEEGGQGEFVPGP